jgi:hypothetical protein
MQMLGSRLRRPRLRPGAYQKTRAFGMTHLRLGVLPAPSLQHLGFVQRADGEAFHGARQVFADFK